jgi:hypothetical protein
MNETLSGERNNEERAVQFAVTPPHPLTDTSRRAFKCPHLVHRDRQWLLDCGYGRRTPLRAAKRQDTGSVDAGAGCQHYRRRAPVAERHKRTHRRSQPRRGHLCLRDRGEVTPGANRHRASAVALARNSVGATLSLIVGACCSQRGTQLPPVVVPLQRFPRTRALRSRRARPIEPACTCAKCPNPSGGARGRAEGGPNARQPAIAG